MDVPIWMRQFEYVAAALPRMQGLPYAAVCFECTPVEAEPLPFTYASSRERDEWAVGHAALSGHRVERYDVESAGPVRCLDTTTRPKRDRFMAGGA